MDRAMPDDYDVLLFDLGGVLVELTGVPRMMEWANGSLGEDELWEKWLASPAVRRFETGRATAQVFGREIVSEFGLAVQPDVFLSEFRTWPRALYPGAEALLGRLGERFRLACLSNSNELHWARFLDEMGIADLFEHHFASHLLGKLKPDAEVFEHVVDELVCEPHRVLFLDDNQACVDGAVAAGLRAHRVRGLDEARATLTRLGLLG